MYVLYKKGCGNSSSPIKGEVSLSLFIMKKMITIIIVATLIFSATFLASNSSAAFPGTNKRLIATPIGGGGEGGGNEGRGLHFGPYVIGGNREKDGLFVSTQWKLHIFNDSSGSGGDAATEVKTCSNQINFVVGLSDDRDIYDAFIYTLERDLKQIERYNYQNCTTSKTFKIRDTSGGTNFTPQGLTFVPNGYHPYGERAGGGVFYWCSSSDGTVYVHHLPNTLADNAVVNAIDSFQPRGNVAGASGMYYFPELGYMVMTWGHAANIYFFRVERQETSSSKFTSLGSISAPADQSDMQAIILRFASAGAVNTFPINVKLPTTTVSMYTLSAEQAILASYDLNLSTISGVGSVQNSGDINVPNVKAFGSRWIRVTPYAGVTPVAFFVRSVDHLNTEGCQTYWLKTDYTLTKSWDDRGVQLPSAWTEAAASGGTNTEFYFSGVQITPEKSFRIYTENATGSIAAQFGEVKMGKFCDTNHDGILNDLDVGCLKDGGGHANCNKYSRDHVATSADYCAAPDATYNESDEGVVCFVDGTNTMSPDVFAWSEFQEDLNCTSDYFQHDWRVETDGNGIDDDCNGVIDVDCDSYAGDFSTASYGEYLACNSLIQAATWDTMDEEEGDLLWRYLEQYTTSGQPTVECLPQNECGNSCGSCPSGQTCIVGAGICVDDPNSLCQDDCGICLGDSACVGGDNDGNFCKVNSHCAGTGTCETVSNLTGNSCFQDSDCQPVGGEGVCNTGVKDGEVCIPFFQPLKGKLVFNQYVNDCWQCVGGLNDGSSCRVDGQYIICKACTKDSEIPCQSDGADCFLLLPSTCNTDGFCDGGIGFGTCNSGICDVDLECGISQCGNLCVACDGETCEFNQSCKTAGQMVNSDCHDNCVAPPAYYMRCNTGCNTSGYAEVPLGDSFYSDLTQKNIRAATVAHGLYIDKQNLVSWNLSDYSALSLGDLFDAEAIMDAVSFTNFQTGETFRGFKHVDVMTFQPYTDYLIMQNNQYLKTTKTATLIELFNYSNTYIHGISNILNFNRPMTVQEMHDTLFEEVQIARNGCHSITRFIEGLCRSVNIPALAILTNSTTGTDPGFFLNTHRSLLLRDEGRVLRHGDDMYTSRFDSFPDLTKTVLISYYEANWETEPCVSLDLACDTPPCNTGNILTDQSDLVNCVITQRLAVVSNTYPAISVQNVCSSHICSGGYRANNYCDPTSGDDDCRNGVSNGTCDPVKRCNGTDSPVLATKLCSQDSDCNNVNLCEGGSDDGRTCSKDRDCSGGFCTEFTVSCVDPNCSNAVLGLIGRITIGGPLSGIKYQCITNAELTTLVNTFENPPSP